MSSLIPRSTFERRNIFSKDDPDAERKINAIFKVLCSQENDIIRPKTFTHFGRNISFEKTCGQVLYTSFEELCDRALGASDYLQLAQYFHTIIIRDIPQLNLKLKSQTRRFITLIDSLYDHRIRVGGKISRCTNNFKSSCLPGCDFVGRFAWIPVLQRKTY